MQQIEAWVESLGYSDYKIEVVSADASYRKYYRLILEDKTFIIMDSSMQVESIYPFIDDNCSKSCLFKPLYVPYNKRFSSYFK